MSRDTLTLPLLLKKRCCNIFFFFFFNFSPCREAADRRYFATAHMKVSICESNSGLLQVLHQNPCLSFLTYHVKCPFFLSVTKLDTIDLRLQLNVRTLKQGKGRLTQRRRPSVLLYSVLARAACAGSLPVVYTITPSSEIPRLNPFSVNAIQMLS